jgi:hypothetical protein
MFLLSFLSWLLPKYAKDSMEAKVHIQDEKNREYVFGIINGYRASGQVNRSRDEVKSEYKNWQILEKSLCQEASPQSMKVWNAFAEHSNFRHFDLKFIYHLPIKTESFPVKLFQSGCFTEPFHSSPDMQDFILLRDVSRVLILRGVRLDSSRKFCVYIKDHFVNHRIAKGIISFDIYEVIS